MPPAIPFIASTVSICNFIISSANVARIWSPYHSQFRISLQWLRDLLFGCRWLVLSGSANLSLKSWRIRSKIPFYFHNTSSLFPLLLFLTILGFLGPISSLFRILCFESRCFGFFDYCLRTFPHPVRSSHPYPPIVIHLKLRYLNETFSAK